jgi:hypothetical protein
MNGRGNENPLLVAATLQTQQTGEILRRQKEADRKSRQLFADGVMTLERYGSRQKGHDPVNRVIGAGIMVPLIPLFRQTPLEVMDSRVFEGVVKNDGSSVQVTLVSDTAVPKKALTLTVNIMGLPKSLVLNSGVGIGEINFSEKHPYENYQVDRTRRANIFEVQDFEDVLHAVPEFVRAEVVPDPKEITELEVLSDESLQKNLGRLRLFKRVTSMAAQFGVVGGLVGAMLAENLEGRQVSTLGIIAVGGGLIVAEAKTNKMVRLMEDELASRDLPIN